VSARRPGEDPRLVRLTRLCLDLPEAGRRDLGPHAGFEVRKRTFAYYLDDHHGDGIVGLNCKVPLGENTDLVALAPERYYLPAYVGHRGWVGLRLDRGAIDWKEVAELVAGSYRLVAPRRLVALLDAGG
jgi:hypothetical protein